jgi:hypothetical protein
VENEIPAPFLPVLLYLMMEMGANFVPASGLMIYPEKS